MVAEYFMDESLAPGINTTTPRTQAIQRQDGDSNGGLGRKRTATKLLESNTFDSVFKPSGERVDVGVATLTEAERRPSELPAQSVKQAFFGVVGTYIRQLGPQVAAVIMKNREHPSLSDVEPHWTVWLLNKLGETLGGPVHMYPNGRRITRPHEGLVGTSEGEESVWADEREAAASKEKGSEA